MTVVRHHLHVTGIVQGVGFRPFVYNLATRHGLYGWVNNSEDGVHIHAEGDEVALEAFERDLPACAPPMARIDRIECTVEPPEACDSFAIIASTGDAPARTLVSPDIATCPACVAELFDPSNRRYHYPFINCTQCGPRFTIIDSLPYDRPRTSMHTFSMCPQCDAEYHDPANRRFHAQPDACFTCGPELFWKTSDDQEPEVARDRTESDGLIARAVDLLRHGGILAVKGIGGYHLACDATDETAVACLRLRKHRPRKPFAIMVPTLESAREICQVSRVEADLLSGAVRPIVLLERRTDAPQDLPPISHGVAFDLPEIGVMLPYTPVQHLLLRAIGRPLVMTSGNLTEEPILSRDDEAGRFLLPIADALLGNNRPILSRYDDSVVRVVDGSTCMVRRARGYAPVPLSLPNRLVRDTSSDLCLLSCGPEQKNTFCLAHDGKAFLSQHLGDLENTLSFDAWTETIALFEHLFDLTPTHLACDMHPEYLSTKWAEDAAEKTGLPLMKVQHHHAHIAAVTGENDHPGRVIGIALDGTGFGDDGAIWGGEILLADWLGYQRVAHLRYLPMPGGAAAVHDPKRMAFGALKECGLLQAEGARPLLDALGTDRADLLSKMVDRGINTPHTSSAGRLLDAVAALLNICGDASYDGQPAIELESAAREGQKQGTDPDVAAIERYAFHDGFDTLGCRVIDPAPALLAALCDYVSGVSPEMVAWHFQEAFARAIVLAASRSCELYGCDTVALGGGVFMNRLLLHAITDGLEHEGRNVLLGKELPANDGCISYGQTIITLAHLIAQESKDNG